MRAQGVVLGGAVYLAIACGSACGGNQTTAPWDYDAGTSNGGSSGSSGSSNNGSNSGSGGSSGSGHGSSSGSGSGFGSSSGSPSGSNSGSGTSGGGSGGGLSSSSSGGNTGSSSSSSSGGNTGSSSGSSSGGNTGSSSGSSSGSTGALDCNSPNLTWHTCNYTVYESYPPPGSAECIQYSGCQYEGQFAYCSQTESKSWVAAHNIVSIYTTADNGAGPYANHRICMKYGGQTIEADVLDTCGNSDCGGCCTQNSAGAEGICDTELGTDMRFLNQGLNGGQNGIQFADLGPDPTACTTGTQ